MTGGTVFSALSGSTIATTAMLGQALVPDMLKRGYHPTMTVGPIIAIGGVDMLIPPSNLAVIFATIASSISIMKVSVAELLIAGTLPGLIMSAGFIIYIVVRCWWNPRLAPPGGTGTAIRTGSRWLPLRGPHSAFAIHLHSDDGQHVCRLGVALEIGSGRLSRDRRAGAVLSRSHVLDPARRASCHGDGDDNAVSHHRRFNDLRPDSGHLRSGRRRAGKLGEFQLTPMATVISMVIILIIMGCFMEQVAMMLLTLPFFVPVANSLNLDMLLAQRRLAYRSAGRAHASAVRTAPVRDARGSPAGNHAETDFNIYHPVFVAIVLGVLALTIYVPWIATGLTR